ncbi:MAG TPA: SDR family oxidoreductase [Dehalococcoidia bacterium]
MEIAGKTALVTGAGSGIGRATALALGQAGAAVVVSDVDDAAGNEAATAIVSAGGRAVFVHTDVSSERDVRNAVSTAQERFGGLDILHANAGRLTGARFPDAKPDLWLRTIAINLEGVLWCIYCAVPVLKRRGGGSIVITASISGLTAHYLDPLYAATKAGLVNLTRSLVFLQREAGIRINCVCPGLVETGLSQHTSAQLTPEESTEFNRSRERLYSQPHLSPEAVAEAVMKLIIDDSLNGKSYQIVLGQDDQIV